MQNFSHEWNLSFWLRIRDISFLKNSSDKDVQGNSNTYSLRRGLIALSVRSVSTKSSTEK